MHIDYMPSREPRPDRHPTSTTIDEPKQAQSATTTIPGRSLLNRNTSVTDILAGLPTPPAWHADAPCSQADPDAWFPEKGGSSVEAKRICADCDVREQCLEWALSNRERFGIFGGTTPEERRRITKESAA